ncbi:MAG: DUF6600 domain-containing protein [Terriglobia bacterium]
MPASNIIEEGRTRMCKEFRVATISVILILLVFGPGLIAKEQSVSHVRVVRLSFVEGNVLVKRPSTAEWAKASVNTPIEQGFSLSTSSNSFAEVEFENGSTARLGQLSQLSFPELALTAKGARINHLVLNSGYGTFRVVPQHGGVYSLQVSNATIASHGKAEFRVDSSQGRIRVEDFQGSVEVSSADGNAKLTKNKVLEYDTAGQMAYNINRGIEKDAWDNWVSQRNQQAELAFRDEAIGINSPMYGWSDLDAYGEWAYFPGFGYGWSPFVPLGWSPYSLGQWSWYPSFGYTWISAEPWGWLPFHTGLWNYAPGFGYFWRPGDLNMWSPALVTWYSGPGYVGWAPLGTRGGAACSGTNCITAVHAGTLQHGMMIDQNTRVPVNNSQLSRVSSPPVAPGPDAMLSGRPIRGNVVFPGMAAQRLLSAGHNSARTPLPTSSSFTAHAQPLATPAPSVILMGQKPVSRASGAASRSFLGRALDSHSRQPIDARMGNTLGGHYVVSGSGHGIHMANGIATGPPNLNLRSRSMRRSSPVFLGHRSAAGFSQPVPRMERGAIRAPSGVGERAPQNGGVERVQSGGGFHSAPAAAPAAPASGGGGRR